MRHRTGPSNDRGREKSLASARLPGPVGARAAAAEAVLSVEQGASLDAALERLVSHVDVDQRGLTSELAFGTCRWYFRLEAIVDRLLERPLQAGDRILAPLLFVGLYQILYTRVPDHAAVAETVAAARMLGKASATGLINAVLRRFQRESASLVAAVDLDPARRYSYPSWLLQALQRAWPDRWETVAAAGNERPPMTLRVNLSRLSRAEFAARLGAAGLTARPLGGVPSALMLEQPVPVERIPGFAQGLASVQDAAAQLAASLLDARSGHRVLDACAAPGGKTAHIAETTPGLDDLVAVDVDAVRLARVEETLQRLGLRARLFAGDAAAPDLAWAAGGLFDRILLDAPCSATGVIRRHPDIKCLRRATDIDALVRRQHAMLRALWPLLAPGGILLYCTCSVLPEENAMLIRDFLADRSDAIAGPLALPWGAASGPGWQILPGEGGCDGFFFARLEKQPA